MIRALNISKSFHGTRVLKNVSTDFEEGKTNLIIGKSGSGKTVFLKCLVGLFEIDEGEIFYNDIRFSYLSFSGRRVIRQQLGMLFQGGALFDSMTVEENIIFPLDMFSSITRDEKIERVNFCLERVDLKNTNKLYPAELSGGMKKRVAIARAISNNPRYLFCDEPNSGLDPRTAIVIDQLISEITKEFNITTVVNTHDMNSVMEIGEKVAFIHEGQLWWEGSKSDFLNSNNPELNDFVFASELMKTLKR